MYRARELSEKEQRRMEEMAKKSIAASKSALLDYDVASARKDVESESDADSDESEAFSLFQSLSPKERQRRLKELHEEHHQNLSKNKSQSGREQRNLMAKQICALRYLA